MERSTKKATKKRHTKPCKFFQLGTCTLSADECDFAHVMTDQPALRSSKPCHFFPAGSCVDGMWCRYRHQTLETPVVEARSPKENMLYSPNEKPSTAIPGPLPIYVGPAPPFHAVYITSPVWPVYSTPGYTMEGPLMFSPPVLSPAASFDSVPSPTAPSTPDSDQGLVWSNDWSEDPVQIGFPSQSPSVSQRSSYSEQSMFEPPVFNHAGFPTNFRPRASHGSKASRQKAESYKTKPCKFYNPGSLMACPNGDACTFIHDPDSDRVKHVSLPRKPLSLKEDNNKRGLFPLSWRVIGGGVLIGPPSESSKEEPEDDDMEIVTASFAPLSRQSNLAAKPMLSIDVGSDFEENQDIPLYRKTPRPRANSIPPTPSIAQTDAQALFSAESPGSY
ncbi:hypothetical protein C8J56DRAFT_28858 [Mycena floridula]|nr:hypothetical protein C8J56DRAFT_28858 [Mycena floridula]